jgi:hypothetical protein
MLPIFYVILSLYALPLGVVTAAASASLYVQEPAPWIKVAVYLAQAYALIFRDAIGNIVLPLLAIFAIKPPTSPDEQVSPTTKQLVLVLAALFLLTMLCLSWTVGYAGAINTTDLGANSTSAESNVNVLRTLLESYGKEFLVYIAIAIGVSKKG